MASTFCQHMNSETDASLPERSIAWDGVSEKRDQQSIDAAVRATMEHDLAIRARQYRFCHAVVIFESKNFIERCRWDEDAKKAIRDDLSDAEEVTLVSYQTSTQAPEPLSGGGETFDFVLHPETLRILHASTGRWRA